MRKLLPLLLICCLLTGCSRPADPAPAAATATPEIHAPAVADLPQSQDMVTLWFRFGDEPLLAPETRIISHSPTEGHALTILRTLIGGPSASSSDLQGLFPQGTQVISCTQSGRIMFVTLSRHIMYGYADEPENWRDLPAWQHEVPQRRVLAMQAIAATLTENCAVDTVVILVADTSSTDSLRLRRGYYTLDSDPAPAPALMRNEALLLTPARTADIILQCWIEKDYARLYRYVARMDPATGAARPTEADFLQQTSALPVLLHAGAAGGSIAADGQSAVFTVSGAYLAAGEEQPFSGMVLRLIREKGVWRVTLSQLTGREALE